MSRFNSTAAGLFLLASSASFLQSQSFANKQAESLDDGGRRAAQIIGEFIETIDEADRKAVLLSYDDPERLRWRRDPGRRPGIALREMTEDQRKKIDAVLQTVLSDDGLSTLHGIRKEQNLLGENEEGLGEGYYWFAVFGEPGNGRWAWRFGGHHVSLHMTYQGNSISGITPLHLGGEILGDSSLDWKGYKCLKPRDNLARKLLMSLDPEQRKKAVLSDDSSSRMVMSEPTSIPFDSLPLEGLAVSEMTIEQKKIVDETLGQFMNPFLPKLSRLLTERAAQADWRFVWAGGGRDGDSHYFRFQSHEIVIEYSDSGTHMHTIVRCPADFGESR